MALFSTSFAEVADDIDSADDDAKGGELLLLLWLFWEQRCTYSSYVRYSLEL